MQEELNQFERNEVWELVPRPSNQSVIGTRWVFRNNIAADLCCAQILWMKQTLSDLICLLSMFLLNVITLVP